MADAQKMIELHSETSERFSCLKQDSSTFNYVRTSFSYTASLKLLKIFMKPLPAIG